MHGMFVAKMRTNPRSAICEGFVRNRLCLKPAFVIHPVQKNLSKGDDDLNDYDVWPAVPER